MIANFLLSAWCTLAISATIVPVTQIGYVDQGENRYLPYSSAPENSTNISKCLSLAKSGNNEEAITLCDKILDANGKDKYLAMKLYVDLMIHNGKAKEAEAQIRNMKVKPLMNYGLGVLADSIVRREGNQNAKEVGKYIIIAERSLQKAAKLEPNSQAVVVSYGTTFMLADLAACRTVLSEYIKNHPKQTIVRLIYVGRLLGYVGYRDGKMLTKPDYQLARKQIKVIENELPQCPEVHYFKGIIAARLNKPNEAILQFNKFLAKPGFSSNKVRIAKQYIEDPSSSCVW